MSNALRTIRQLLPLAEATEMREFMLKQVLHNSTFEIELLNWLNLKYGAKRSTNGEQYRAAVRNAFALSSDSDSWGRRRSYSPCIAWSAVGAAVQEVLSLVQEQLRSGTPDGVEPAVMEFLRLLDMNGEDYILLDEGDGTIEKACRDAAKLLVEWSGRTETEAVAKQRVMQQIEAYASKGFYRDYGVIDMEALQIQMMRAASSTGGGTG